MTTARLSKAQHAYSAQTLVCGEALLKSYPFNSSFGKSRPAIHLVTVQLFFRKGRDQYSGVERIDHLRQK